MAVKTIKIAQWAQINILYLPVYLAMESRALKKAGYACDLILAGNDDAIFKTMASSAAHFGVGDPAFCAMKKNVKFEAHVVATISGRISFYGITRNPVISTIDKPADLVNLRLSTFPKPSTSYALLKHMKESHKRLLRSMRIIECPVGDQFHLLADNRADIVIDIEPFVSVAESKGCRAVYSYAAFHGPFAFTGLYTSQAVIDSEPQMVEAMGAAVREAFYIIHNDPQKTLNAAQSLFPKLDIKILKRAIDRLRKDRVWQKHPETTTEAWEAAIAVRVKLGEKFADDIYACIDNDYVGGGRRKTA